MLRPICTIPALLLLGLSPAPALAGSVAGSFIDAGARTALAGVEVVLRHAADSTLAARAVTGPDGRFGFDSLALGGYRLRASRLGYVAFRRDDVRLTAGASELDIGTQALAVSPIPVKGVEAATARPSAIVAADRNIYLTKDMPSAATGTAIELLRTVSELDVDIDGRVSLRGSSSVSIQFNGRAAPLKGEALATFLRQMPASRIERVEVIANPSAKFDPEGMAGIVNLVLEDDAGLGLSGSVNLSAGQRYSGTGSRIAWQQGPLTVFGGINGTLFNYRYDSDAVRRSLLTSPPSALAWDVQSRYRGRSGLLDGSFDFAIDKRSTLYGTVNGSGNDGDTHSPRQYAFTDSTQTLARRYDRTDDGGSTYDAAALTLGFQHVVQQGRNERTFEYMQSYSAGENDGDGLEHSLVPAGTADRTWAQDGAWSYRERSLQADDVHPLGARAKLELGYRGVQRRNASASRVNSFAGGLPAAAPSADTSDYAHREAFHSGYATVGSTFGRLSVQVGARAEFARTTFDVSTMARHDEHEYRSLFPSANVAWDFGKGRTLRAAYSKRIERPSAYYLNPDSPSSDTLHRFVGNPRLGPKYTHSLTLDASWSGSLGLIRLSPYLRETVDNWDQVTSVDAGGVGTSTYRNASSVRVVGVNVTVSLRQAGRLGGTLSVGVLREHHDAGNLSSQYRRDVTGWSSNGNLVFKATEVLDLQGYLRYAPPRAYAQGRSSAYVGSSITARYKLGAKAWASLSFNDPLDLSTSWTRTGDDTYEQENHQRNRMRSVSGALTWTWGKAPEPKQRRQSTETPQPEGQGQGP